LNLRRGMTTMIRLALPRFDNRRRKIAAALVLLAFATLMAAPDRAAAQTNSGSFTLKITEKEMKLEHPTDMTWDKYLMWDLAFQRMNDRNMPYIELANDATSTAPITELHITIGDNRFHFANDALGEYAMAGSTTHEFDLTSSTIDGNELVVNIGNGGLQPGDLVRFKIDLDVDAEFTDEFFAHPDYRTVLFDMNGFNVYDGLQQQSASDNAKVWAIFDPAVGANLITAPVALQDELVSGPAAEFYNDNYRRYGEMDPVRTFQLVGGTGAVIPEPGTLALIYAGVLGGLVFGRRARTTPRTT
jgi:hypothetical protein